MTLSALEKLDLADQLDDLILKAPTVKGLDLLDLNDQMEEIMLKLGYGAGSIPAPAPALALAHPHPDAGDEPAKEEQPTPEIVADFLAGKFTQQSQMDFVETLRRVGDYIGLYLDLDDAKQQTASWIAASGLAA